MKVRFYVAIAFEDVIITMLFVGAGAGDWIFCIANPHRFSFLAVRVDFRPEKGSWIVSKKFGGLEKSRTFALPLKNGLAVRPVVLTKTGAWIKTKKNWQKIWKLKNNAYLCSPVRITGPLTRVLKVHWKDWLLYKKQVPRNTIYREALILLKGL